MLKSKQLIMAFALGTVAAWGHLTPGLAAGTHHRAALGGHGGIVGHPLGCPHRRFCACGASVRVFGHSVRNLWLARSWLRFATTYPAPGMVAASFEHVMVLEQQLYGKIWIVYDANSGGHLTRVHARSIEGFAIVDPRS